MTIFRLEVEKAYPNDGGRGIARLNPEAFSHLGLTPGDHIEIEGSDTTMAKARHADRQDWETDMVRIDEFTRQNADVDIGKSVEIRRAEVMEADSLTFRSFEDSPVKFCSDDANKIKHQILKRSVVKRDIVPIMANYEGEPSMDLPRQAIPILTVGTEPKRMGIVGEETSVAIQNETE
jgi:transitional endoplasmic reticulum ATPase